MNLVSLSEVDLSTVDTLFTQFHANYTGFFQTQTRCVAKPARDYLHGQLFIKQRQNLTQYCGEVPESEYSSMQHFISNSPWNEVGLRRQLQRDGTSRLGDAIAGALNDSGVPKPGIMSVGVGRQDCGSVGKVDTCPVGGYLA